MSLKPRIEWLLVFVPVAFVLEFTHANEVAILPYYVANLNIEATFAAVSGQYAEFPNLCFVDTLDNVAGLGIKSGHQHDLFAALSVRLRRTPGAEITTRRVRVPDPVKAVVLARCLVGRR